MRFFYCTMAVAVAVTTPAESTSAEANAIEPSNTAPMNVYFIREYAEPTAWAVTIKVDSIKVAALGNRTYTAVQLAPGDYKLSIAWPIFSAQSGSDGRLIVENGKIYVVSIGGVSRVVGGTVGTLQIQMGSGINIHTFDSDARVDFSCCKLKEGKYKPDLNQISSSK